MSRARQIEHDFNTLATAPGVPATLQPLRLGVLSTVPTRLIEAIVRANAAAHRPDALEIVEGTDADLRSRLRRRRIDAALTILGDTDRGGLVELLRTEGYGLAVWSSHPLARHDLVQPEELAGEVMLVRRSCEVLRETSRYFTDRGVRPRFSFRTFSEDRAAAMVRAGLGITVAPDSWREPGVSLIPLAAFEPTRKLGLLFAEGWPPGETKGHVVLDAVRHLVAHPAADGR